MAYNDIYSDTVVVVDDVVVVAVVEVVLVFDMLLLLLLLLLLLYKIVLITKNIVIKCFVSIIERKKLWLYIEHSQLDYRIKYIVKIIQKK